MINCPRGSWSKPDSSRKNYKRSTESRPPGEIVTQCHLLDNCYWVSLSRSFIEQVWVHSGENVPECHSVDHSLNKLCVYSGEIVPECHSVDHSFSKLYVYYGEIVIECHLVDHSFNKLYVNSVEIVTEHHLVDHSLNKHTCLLRRDCCWASLSRDCCWALLGPSFMQLAVCLLYLCLSQCCFACLSYIFVYVLTSLYILVCPCSASKKSSTPRTTLGTGRGEGDSESEEDDAIEEEEEIYEAIVSKERSSIVYPNVYTALTCLLWVKKGLVLFILMFTLRLLGGNVANAA